MSKEEDAIKKAKELRDKEQFENSIIILEDLFNQNPSDEVKKILIETLFAYGAILNDIYVLEYQKAEKCFKRIIEIDPLNYRAHYNLAIALTNLGNFDLALESCNKAIEIKPDYKHCYYNIGLIYEIKEDYINALEYYEKTLDLDPNFTYGIQAVNSVREILQSEKRRKNC